MNSSTRIKAPRGSKVMDQKDFNENEDIFEDSISVEGQDEEEPPSATNTVLNIENDGNVVPKHDCVNNEGNISNTDVFETEFSEIDNIYFETSVIHKSKSLEGLEDCAEDDGSVPSSPAALTSPTENAGVRSRDRKLSFDHTMLLRREGLSQSEVDLHFMGKSPLVRKSSFFRRKMESFLKNTTEIFKRQSQTSKTTTSSLKQRKGSNCSRMSVSLQSLNENSAYGVDYEDESIDKYHVSRQSVYL
ncbi:Uncharacterized protein OBRU01_00911 [Operophtera brumata]|uniref:Uncharacterized protein n=1 Tax=Operophtera brumata TaxID=104452 RepID=A0A0L7LUP6_OPEBR|nr:Uncharacterized protein OBRU01_00911 [Operophtera brumata]